jgi:EF-P beta-lysylation protein EpmB
MSYCVDSMIKKKPWQIALSQSIDDFDTLAKRLKLKINDLKLAKKAEQDFALKIPQAWLKKIKRADPDDPLLRQVLPLGKELTHVAGFEPDSLQELQASPTPGMLHKYRSRVLLIMSGSCAINCRYCFRRNFPYNQHQKGQGQWQQALEYIAQDPQINEVIFSGGEPLLLPDNVLEKLAIQLAQLPQLKTLRIHTRLPVFIPERLDHDFLKWFTNGRFKAVMVLHINHPNEIDAKFAKKMQTLKKKGVTLLNQSVLLKGVNDDAQILKALSEKLFFDCGIQPYYLNLLDKIKGVAHFLVARNKASLIYQELLGLLPGYLVPKLVVEIPGEASKVPVANPLPRTTKS